MNHLLSNVIAAANTSDLPRLLDCLESYVEGYHRSKDLVQTIEQGESAEC